MYAPPPQTIDPDADRLTIGRQLPAAYFHDGGIYGIDPKGRLCDHCIDTKPARAFLQGLQRKALRGTGC